MAAPSRRAGLVLSRLKPRQPRLVCSQCLSRPASRAITTATPRTPIEPPPPLPSTASGAQRAAPHRPPPQHLVSAGIILTRAPLLTRPATAFEQAFYFYQRRLNERLSMPFVKNVYFKPDTPARMDFFMKLAARGNILARELGDYSGHGREAWADELQVGDGLSDPAHATRVLLRDAVPWVSEDAEVIPERDRGEPEPSLGRETEADRRGDMTRLERKLDRTLYLVVRDAGGTWRFPEDQLKEGEVLHEASQRVLDQAAGVNMNTWIIGRVPVAHHVTPPTLDDQGTLEKMGSKTFFLKGRIMAGQVDLSKGVLGYTDFRWLTRDEVEALVSPEYFKGVRNMMPAR